VVRLSDLRERDVVDVRDGRRLGAVSDLEIDPAAGQVVALVVPGAARLLGLFGSDGECVIPWGDIVTIGHDVILVRQAAPGRSGG
jgi:YlmC/YmxH family sporulation protein